ncbi:MAG: leucine-rich repeat protein [Spirochaetia bacterium]
MKTGLFVLLGLFCLGMLFNCSNPTASTYSVTYDGNGASSGSVPTDSNKYKEGATVTVLGNTGSLAKTSYTFAGWNTKSDGSGTGYGVGVTFSMGSANVTLYAVWIQNLTYTVTYSGNGSTSGNDPTDTNNYKQGATVIVLGNTGNLTLSGYNFAGWNTNANGSGTSYAAGATFTMASANITLYAVWIPSNLTFTSSGTYIIITGYTTAPIGSLAIPGGVTNINPQAFFTCSSLTSVTIPSSVTSIGSLAFGACAGLTSISVDSDNPNYESISGVLFDKSGTTLLQAPCALTGNYAIPTSVTSIGDCAFEESALTSVTIPSSVTSIGVEAFAEAGLTSVIIPSSITSIGTDDFIQCTNLASVTIPSSVTSIGNGAFGGCTSLTSVTIPSGVTSIDNGAFDGCTLLNSVTVMATTPPALPSGSLAFSNCANTLKIYVPSDYVDTYKNATGWKDYASIIYSQS